MGRPVASGISQEKQWGSLKRAKKEKKIRKKSRRAVEKQFRAERGLMSRAELLELDYERLQRELGNVGDWVLEVGEEMSKLRPSVELYHSLKAELTIIKEYKSLLQSILRAQRDTV